MQSGWRWTVWMVNDGDAALLGARMEPSPAVSERVAIAPSVWNATLYETGAAIIGLVAPPTLSGGVRRWNR